MLQWTPNTKNVIALYVNNLADKTSSGPSAISLGGGYWDSGAGQHRPCSASTPAHMVQGMGRPREFGVTAGSALLAGRRPKAR